jgi:hypothetical protein
MRRLATLALMGLLAASPALAQAQAPRPQAPAPTQPAAPAVTAQAPAPVRPAAPAPVAAAPARTGFGAGHALALGAGMFGGAVLGSALINGGSFAAVVGAVAGLATGHWYYLQHRNEFD